MNSFHELTFQLMINASPNALLLVDTKGDINFLNRSAEELFGYTNDELKGKEISTLVPDKHQSAHNNHVDNYSKQPSKKIMAEESNPFARKKNGSLFPVEIVLNPIVTTESTYILASIIDISERIKEMDEKRKNDELFRIVVESAPNAILLVNETGNMTLVNRQTENLFGYKREELIGQNIEILLPERYKSGHRDLVKMFFHNPQTRPMGAGRDLFAIRKDGTEIPIEIGLTPISLPQGKVVLTSIIDITERKKNEEIKKLQMQKIAHKNKELEQFTYIVSHDLRAPLQTISSFNQLIIDDQSEYMDETGRQNLHFIKEAANRMSELLSGLLEYGRLGKQSQLTDVDLNKVVGNVIADLNYSITKSNAKINIEALPTIRAYATEIRLLFQNLISNAIKYCDPNVNPEVTVSYTQEKSYWKFCVKDNGIGISPENREKIFVLFKRLENENDYEGTGIGLAHCRKIVALHNGEIGVDSELGKGSNFYFTINKNPDII